MEEPFSFKKATLRPQEVEEGNNEYKLMLTNLTEDQFRHRVTQLNWRLNEGNDVAVYHLGLFDNGFPKGLSPSNLEESLESLRRMSDAVGCTMTVNEVCQGEVGLTAEVCLRRAKRLHINPVHVQIAVAGDVDSGKSTLISVLAGGSLDNGRGIARAQIVRRAHELETGRTSSLSTHILYFSAHGKVLNSELFDPVQSSSNSSSTTTSSSSSSEQVDSGASSSTTTATASSWKRVLSRSPGSGMSSSRLRSRSDLELSDEACRTVSFIDLAGSSKYLKTTLHGIVGHRPDWLCLCVSASNRCNGSLLSSITAEHLGLAFALAKPLLVVVTKTDTVSDEVVSSLVASLVRLLSKPLERQAVLVESLAQIKLLHSCTPHSHSQPHDCSDNELETTPVVSPPVTTATVVPIFQVSNVTGAGLDLLRSYLFQLPQHTKCWVDARARHTEVRIVGSFIKSNAGIVGNDNSNREADTDSNRSSSSVTVLSGQVLSGVVSLGDVLLVGPLGAEGVFLKVTVVSLRVNNVAVKKALAGQLTTLVVEEQSPSPSPQTATTSVPSPSAPSGTEASWTMAEMTRTGSLNTLGCKSPRSTSSLSSYAMTPGNGCSSSSNNNLATLPTDSKSSKQLGEGHEGDCSLVDNNNIIVTTNVPPSSSSRSSSPDTESKDCSKDMDTDLTATVANSSSKDKVKRGNTNTVAGSDASPSLRQQQQYQLLSQYQLGLPGQVLLSPLAQPVAYWEFDAEFLCLFHPGKVSIMA